MQEVAPEVRELYLKLPQDAYAMAFVAIAPAQRQINIMNSAVKWALGLASLGVAVYVVGYAWRASQNRQANEEANFSNAAGKATCLCRGVKMPCSSGYYKQHCGQGGGRPVSSAI